MADGTNGPGLPDRGCGAGGERFGHRLGGGRHPHRQGSGGTLSRAELALRASRPAAPRAGPQMMAASLVMRPRVGVGRFLAWWSSELSDVAAARAARSRPWRVMFLRRDGGCDVYVRARDRVQQVGSPRAGGGLPV